MFKKHENGTVYEVCGLECNIPPEGMVYNYNKQELEYIGVYQRSSIKKQQFWERPPEPKDYDKKEKLEKLKKEKDPEYFDSELQEYRIQEWHRRLYGFWFMNNGVPTYLTGLNYFYLAHWQIDIGYPDFRIPDMEFFYFLEYAVQDPNSIGVLELTKRRQGKSARSGVFIYDYISRSKRSWGGIQSKSLEDAKQNVFSGFIVSPFKQLKSFFRPVYDTDQGTTPKRELRFYKPNKRGANAADYDYSGELESTIDYKSSELFAYDGKKLQRYTADECGKTKDIDVYQRHQVVQYCLQLDGKIIGKALYTTTVEDMDNGGEAFKRLWDGSNIKKRDANGRTKTGLYRYFLPAYRTLYYDEYGFPDEEKGKEYYLNTRAALQEEPNALASEIRKNPFTIEEAFRIDGDTCMYDPIKIQKQLDAITWRDEKEILTRGNFLWEDGERDKSVIFVPDIKGKFLLHNGIDYTQGYNVVEQYGTKKRPRNITKFVAGADPFSHNTTVDSRRSDGAAYVYRKYDATSDLSETFVCEYIFRPKTADIFYEDMIRMCHFFGCQVLPEDNKIGMIQYFERRGYEKFLLTLPNRKSAGIPANKKTHQQLAEETELYVYENCDKVVYKRLLEDWLLFDINNTTSFDAAMAGGWTLVAAGSKKFKNEVKPDKYYEAKEIFG